MTTEREIVLTNPGAVDQLVLKVTPGRITEVLGDNGVGKSTVLNEVDAAVTGRKPKTTVHDGAKKATVECFGIKMTLGKSRRRKGELEVVSFDDRYGLYDILEPPFKDEEARESHRVRAMCYLLNLDTDQAKSKLRTLLKAEEFDAIVSQSTLDKTDIVAIAKGTKADIEKKARDYETQRDNLVQRSKEKRSHADGVDLEQEHDQAVLQSSVETALQKRQELRTKKETSEQAVTARRRTEAAVAGLRASTPDVEKRKAELLSVTKKREAVADDIDEADTEVARLESVLQGVKAARKLHYEEQSRLEDQHKQCKDELQQAEQHEADLQALESELAELQASATAAPSADDIVAAENTVLEARQANDNGVLIRKALEAIEEADRLKEESKDRDKHAERLREAAKSVDAILSDMLLEATDKFRVIGGQLVAEHPKRGWVPFDSGFSDGQKARVVIPMLLERTPDLVLTIPQRIYQGISPSGRKELAAVVADTNAMCVAGQVADGELRSDYYGASNEELAS